MKNKVLAGVFAATMAASALVGVAPASASAGSESGVNIGFAFTWDEELRGSSASFLLNNGKDLNNCAPGNIEDPNFAGCNFLHAFKIGIESETNYLDLSSLPYGSAPQGYIERADDSSANNSLCGAGDVSNFMLTNFNCFNQNSYGQIFRANASGELEHFKMAISCLSPNSTPVSITAILYELTYDATSGVSSLVQSIGAQQITLSSCATSWQAKQFSAADFEVVTMAFGNPTLTKDKSYGVYFAGEFVPGTAPIGSESLVPATTADVDRAPAPFTGPILNTPAIGPVVAGGKLVISGSNLGGVSKIEIGGLDAQVVVLSDGSIEITVPRGLAAGVYDIVITSDAGRVTVQGGLTVAAGACLATCAAGEPRPSTKMIAANNVKVWVFEAYGAGKVQIKLNGREVAWANALSADDPKLRDGYLVRTLTLAAGKNVIEVYVDGERISRRVATGS